MQEILDKVKTKEGGPWEYKIGLPETVSEAVEVYGEEGALYLLNAGLKVKMQNVARETLANGGTVEEAEKKAREYRPGGGMRQSLRTRAFDLITMNVQKMNEDATLRNKIREFVGKNDFKSIITEFTGEVFSTTEETDESGNED